MVVEDTSGSVARTGSLALGVLALLLWWAFASSFSHAFTTSCGPSCVTTSTEVGVSVGIYLGLAVLASVFSAALLVVHLVRDAR